ncbi:hypothetical protein HanXRQr2_Chr16g0745801 [Helianthus annuus]|uniref:Uncharacterized protein n=1 Tax=Helianthus annuus TaxID=4232 RepID=A0A9K3GXN3_HELAN|nr:hypothetical protein HanXRQr2_Chr16g0745801 [Helianthus annuus]KAJ0821016.1 hypothetical protein HanPSC8_Chr16g0714991 [Helianthus annuus]
MGNPILLLIYTADILNPDLGTTPFLHSNTKAIPSYITFLRAQCDTCHAMSHRAL